MILLDSSYSHFQSHSCLCLKKRGYAFPACARKSSKYKDFPFFRCSPFSLCILQEWDGEPVPPVPFLWETGIKKVQNGYAGRACFMSVERHGATGYARSHIWADESRTPPLTSPRACARWSLTDGTGTQGQAGCARPSQGALYHRHTGNPRAGRGCAPVAVFIPSGCESRDRQGIPAPVTLSLMRGAYGRLYGGNGAARRPGCKDERI